MSTHEQASNGTEPNESSLDRMLRFSAGLVLITLAFTGEIGAWGYVGLFPVLTGVVGICPLYGLIGVSTADR